MSQEAEIAEAEFTEIAKIEKLTAEDIFKPGGLDPVLAIVAADARSVVPDISTAKGRKSIASTAYRVAQTKTLIDNKGKDLVAVWKQKAKVVDDERKRARDYLDGLRDEIRAPLTAFEENEKRKVAAIDGIRQAGQRAANGWISMSLEQVSEQLAAMKEARPSADDWGDHHADALVAWDGAVAALEGAVQARANYERQQAELAELREQARLRDEEQAQQAKPETAPATPAPEPTTTVGSANPEPSSPSANSSTGNPDSAIQHKMDINNRAKNALVMEGFTEEQARKVISLIARGMVPRVTIDYNRG